MRPVLTTFQNSSDLARRPSLEFLHGGEEGVSDSDGGGDLNGGRNDVVGGLAFVDVVVGVNGVARAEFAAHGFDGDV